MEAAARPLTDFPQAHRRLPRAVPFRSAEEAWFWTSAALRARSEGTRTAQGAAAAPL